MSHGERDEFRFEIARQGRYVVETLGSSDVVMELVRADEPEMVIATDDDSGDRLNPRIEASLPTRRVSGARLALLAERDRRLQHRFDLGMKPALHL